MSMSNSGQKMDPSILKFWIDNRHNSAV